MKKKLLTLLAIGTFIAANPAAAEDSKYSQGVFIINEGIKLITCDSWCFSFVCNIQHFNQCFQITVDHPSNHVLQTDVFLHVW